jgi:hypothetical protein
MDAPLCKLCGERHWNWGECQRIVTAIASARDLIRNGSQEPKKKRGPRGSFDRKTYQRELMRKRRAK